MTERELLGAIVDLARTHQWKVAHFASVPTMRRGQTFHATPVQADGKGFPDLVMVRERVLAVEVKGGGHKPTVEQADWLSSFRMAGCRAFVWTPKAWADGSVEAELHMRIKPLPGPPAPLVLPDAPTDPYLWESGT